MGRWDIPGCRRGALKFILRQSIEFPPVMYPCRWVGQKTQRFLSALITESFKNEVDRTYPKFKLI